MDESGGNHTTGSKSEGERHIPYYINYRCYLKIDIPMKVFPQRKAITDFLNFWITNWKVVKIGYIRILGLTEIYKHR